MPTRAPVNPLVTESMAGITGPADCDARYDTAPDIRCGTGWFTRCAAADDLRVTGLRSG
jgi:hypothetical protein